MAAETAQLTSESEIQWSGGQPFNGYVVLKAMVGGVEATAISLKDSRPVLRVPSRIMVPIREGHYVSDTYIWRTDSFVPPGVTYDTFFYDSNDRLVANGSTGVTVTTAVHTLAPPTLDP